MQPFSATAYLCGQSGLEFAKAAAVIECDYQNQRRPAMPERVRAIIDEVSVEYGVPDFLILGKTQAIMVVRARYEAMRRIHALSKFSFADIGRWFGRHHSTVHYAVCGDLRRRKLQAFKAAYARWRAARAAEADTR
jgi:chromosomal replication initiation ATPase DnaA